ncbi:hypothetical protein GMDG_05858 [Pseudogymnoascus destructans 20631-21]|uniref:Core Histone H2A/H2B/H3 domain-containing protein n=1 Tax=Pseudogymnoascus destructans (strain ATCC MYA-4855 / 20631-21) TaxID=658429 RepID=L8FRA7_PSED2|nr:hypothetical protein GMDG_05858 [Pseudogymnoascus destructans 20631-21]
MPSEKPHRKHPQTLQSTQKPKCCWKSGVVARRQIKRYQKLMEPLIPRAPFIRLIREDLKVDFRLQSSAVSVLQEAAEMTLVKEFEMTQLAAIYAKRVMIQQKDMKLVQAMCLHMTGFAFPGMKE